MILKEIQKLLVYQTNNEKVLIILDTAIQELWKGSKTRDSNNHLRAMLKKITKYKVIRDIMSLRKLAMLLLE